MHKIRSFFKKTYSNALLKSYRKGLRNKNFTIISRNCIGGVVYHQYGLKFLSPTINLYIKIDEFNIFCLNLKQYLFGKLIEDTNNSLNYPVGILHPCSNDGVDVKPIRIYFMHYNSFKDAYTKWNDRKSRINWDNIYVINDCTTEGSLALLNKKIITEFNKIPYKKMIFVRQHFGFDNECVIKNSLGMLNKNSFVSWRYNFNHFNFNKFFNK